ncbi:glutathione ABC transporter permease [Primorskyibacter flagellatus]|uniref:Glutathione ABC transporter permease n=1 Tax=Primorskyibacter flagellatus TaxID=1387277 RepID=A0A916ZV23_9RHOB|nr:ABC transporter permease [Primorskyibacter flagellatus]GGE15543.1 glutathione ABC transporter permease [Primorskyibacter flagellatus]
MTKYILMRSFQVLPVLLGVTFLVFLSLYLLPGDVTLNLLGLAANEDSIARLRAELGLDRPFSVQFGIWLGRALQGDLGVSHVMRTPVTAVVLEKTGNSLILMGAGLAITVVGAALLGPLSAVRKDRATDHTVKTLTFLLASMPAYWLGLVLIVAFSITLPWLPASGMYDFITPGGLPDLTAHLFLPALTTAATSLAIVTRVTRAAMVEALARSHVTAARSRGVRGFRLLYGHGVRAILPTFVNICGLQIGYLFGSSIFTEVIFSWPGIGQQLYTSIIARDGPMVQGCVLAVALVFVLGNLLADILIRWLDVHRD